MNTGERPSAGGASFFRAKWENRGAAVFSQAVAFRYRCAREAALPVARIMTVKFIATLALAASAASLCFGAAPTHAAAGAEPWCLNDDEGNSHCNYASSQACLAAVSGGGRGFCNVNSSGPPAPATAPAPEPRKHRGQTR
jgi:hypothetical protein